MAGGREVRTDSWPAFAAAVSGAVSEGRSVEIICGPEAGGGYLADLGDAPSPAGDGETDGGHT